MISQVNVVTCHVKSTMEPYLERYVKSVVPPTTILEKGSGKLILGGIDVVKSGEASRFDHVISVICLDHLVQFLHSSIAQNQIQKRQHYDIDDDHRQKISDILDVIADDISTSLNEGKTVYVHCFMGISRSASMVVAYLVKHENMTLQEAIDFVKEKRRIGINLNFKEQLQKWESKMSRGASGSVPCLSP